MIIEIEYYKSNTFLYGSKISFGEFKRQIKTVETLYDKEEDNFVALLCRMYHWTITKEQVNPQFIYDRDIEKTIEVHYNSTQ